MKKIFLLILLFSSLNLFSDNSKVISDKTMSLIDELLLITGSSGKEVGLNLSKSFRTVFTDSIATGDVERDIEIVKIIDESVEKVIIDKLYSGKKLNEMLYPIYAKNFTDAELTELINFYKTDIGQILLKKMPNVIQESFLVGQKFGESLVPLIASEIEKKLEEAEIDLSYLE